jgi:hypothetical protein
MVIPSGRYGSFAVPFVGMDAFTRRLPEVWEDGGAIPGDMLYFRFVPVRLQTDRSELLLKLVVAIGVWSTGIPV